MSAVTFLLATQAAMAQPATPATTLQPRIVVTGEGEATARPDMAVLTLSVMREAATAREAMDGVNTDVAEVIEAMKQAGVEDRDLQTSGLQINPRYHYPRDGEEGQPRIDGYQVTNTLTVRVREIDKAGEVIDRSVTLGVNQGGNIQFTNADTRPVLAEARKDAVKDAMDKARTLAEAAGVTLGPILEISEQTGYMPPPRPFMARAAADMAEKAPIEAGENTYNVLVNVTFGIAGSE
ncbi:MAG: SIMPL domain-containing protein [Rhizobiaceae bacterium]|nr:SIMPL domain-containing protein [Rhizobiaceae bacterium]MCV0408041.1 SIMPL domain-containing protein [Rhizobiaceae bacterium]